LVEKGKKQVPWYKDPNYMIPVAATILTVLIAAGYVLLHNQPQLISMQNVSAIILILISPAIISAFIYFLIKGYWQDVILPRFTNPRSENILVKVFDLWFVYTFFSLFMSICIFVYLKLNTRLGSSLTEQQSFITSVLILILIFMTGILVANGDKDPFWPFKIFFNTIVVLIVINLIMRADSLPTDMFSLWSSYFDNFADFLNFSKYIVKYVYIGCIGLAIFGDLLIKYLHEYYKK
jgi:hypothetical protein